MKSQSYLVYVAIAFFMSTVGCQSLRSTERDGVSIPEIQESTSSDEALKIAVDFGGDRVEKAVQMIAKRKGSEKAAMAMEQSLQDQLLHFQNNQILNAANLYQQLTKTVSLDLFRKYVRSDRPVAKQVAWQWAAAFPSKTLSKAIDDELSLAVSGDEEQDFTTPEMANAVRVNRVKSSYTLIREGLMSKGDEAFARAMMSLNPEQASVDFLRYLALAPVEELRQLNQKTVNTYTCMFIFRHMASYPPPTTDPYYEQVFLFAVSRNPALSELANGVLRQSFSRGREGVAAVLARLPSWIQVAYLEYARRNLSPEMNQFLLALKERSSQEQVVEEIDEIIR